MLCYAKSLQSCPTVRPHRRQPTRFPVPGILQARTLEWGAIAFSAFLYNKPVNVTNCALAVGAAPALYCGNLGLEASQSDTRVTAGLL